MKLELLNFVSDEGLDDPFITEKVTGLIEFTNLKPELVFDWAARITNNALRARSRAFSLESKGFNVKSQLDFLSKEIRRGDIVCNAASSLIVREPRPPKLADIINELNDMERDHNEFCGSTQKG